MLENVSLLNTILKNTIYYSRLLYLQQFESIFFFPIPSQNLQTNKSYLKQTAEPLTFHKWVTKSILPRVYLNHLGFCDLRSMQVAIMSDPEPCGELNRPDKKTLSNTI